MKEKILEKFEEKFVADNILDCIPKKNWEEMKDEVWAFIDEYADWKIKECLPEEVIYIDENLSDKDYEKISKSGKTFATKDYSLGWNDCIDQILANKDKK